MIPDGGRLILVSRAATIDFTALYERVTSGHLLAAVDVWPSEPAAADDAARRMEGLVLSAHRAGAIAPAFHAIGDMVIDDLELLSANLPPVRMQIAARELVQRYRSRPVMRE
jgi:phosphoglycerate dehydrogenase-like enzyme